MYLIPTAMATSVGIAYFLFALVAFVDSSNVVRLDFDNYYSYWKKNDVTFVKFYTPKEERATAIVQTWEELANRLKVHVHSYVSVR